MSSLCGGTQQLRVGHIFCIIKLWSV